MYLQWYVNTASHEEELTSYMNNMQIDPYLVLTADLQLMSVAENDTSGY